MLTSAVRDAANGRTFARALARALRARRTRDQRRYGGTPHLPGGDLSDRAPTARERPTLVIDIGGGSTELVIGTGATIVFQVSTQAGVVRQSERHVAVRSPD